MHLPAEADFWTAWGKHVHPARAVLMKACVASCYTRRLVVDACQHPGMNIDSLINSSRLNLSLKHCMHVQVRRAKPAPAPAPARRLGSHLATLLGTSLGSMASISDAYQPPIDQKRLVEMLRAAVSSSILGVGRFWFQPKCAIASPLVDRGHWLSGRWGPPSAGQAPTASSRFTGRGTV
jgi:hypothetical protein